MKILYHPEYEGLSYGPGNDGDANIRFGPLGGTAPHYALVEDDNPLLERLLADEPAVRIVPAVGAGEAGTIVEVSVFVCPVCDREFNSKSALRGHSASHKASEAPPV